MRAPLAAILILVTMAAVFGAFLYNGTVDGTGAAHTTTVNKFQEPYAVSYMNGMLYVADSQMNYVLGLTGNDITKWIGSSGGNGLNKPRGLYTEDGLVFIADAGNGHGKIYDGTSVMKVIGLEYNLEATLPEGIAADNDTIYLVDYGGNRIKTYDRKTMQPKDQWGSPGIGDYNFNSPTRIVVTDDKIYVADSGNDRIQVYSKNFTYITSIGRGRGGVTLSRPEGIFVGDRIYVADTGNSRIIMFSLAGDPLETFGRQGAGDGEFNNPRDLYYTNGTLYVADTDNQRIQIFAVNDSADETVLAALNRAAVRVSAYEELAAAGAKIDVKASSDARTSLDLAQKSIQENRLIDAATQIAAAENEANTSIIAVQSALDFRLRSMVGLSRQRIGELPDSVGNDDRVRIGTMISTVESDISGQKYAEAVDLVLNVESELSKLGAGGETVAPVEPVANGTTADDGRTQLAETKIRKVTEQIRAVEDLAGNYNITVDSLEVDALITNARGKLVNDDTDGALTAIADAEAKADSLIKSVEQKLSDIEKAKAATADAEKQIKATETSYSGSIVKPDLASAKKMLADAKAATYSDPESALTLATNAKASAIAEGRKAADSNDLAVKGGVAAIFTLAGAVAIAAVVIFLVLKRRRRGL